MNTIQQSSLSPNVSSKSFFKEQKQISFAEYLQIHNDGSIGKRCSTSPTQDITYSGLKILGNQLKKEDSEPSFRFHNPQAESNEAMSEKVGLLISENQKLIQINSELMREIEMMRNNSRNQSVNNNESSQRLKNYQEKVLQLTQANEQLSSRLIEEQTKNQDQTEQKLSQLIQENHKVNMILKERLEELQYLQEEVKDKQKQLNLVNEQNKALIEKCQVLEQQKSMLLDQNNNITDNVYQFQVKEAQLQQLLYEEQMKYQNCIKTLEQNYQIQFNELQSGINQELQQQSQQIKQQCNQYYTQQIETLQEQYNQLQIEYNQIKTELNERQNIWKQEKQRLQDMIQNKQSIKQIQDSHYTFRQQQQLQNEENSIEISEDGFLPNTRVSTEVGTLKQNYNRPPLLIKNKVPDLNMLNRYDYLNRANQNVMAKQIPQENGDHNLNRTHSREPSYSSSTGRSYSQYLQKEEVRIRDYVQRYQQYRNI